MISLLSSKFEHLFVQNILLRLCTDVSSYIPKSNIKAYTMGPELYVEVDVVMKPDTPLWQSHDASLSSGRAAITLVANANNHYLLQLSQKFQDDLETLPGVGRAFVHVDHEVSHSAEHSKRK